MLFISARVWERETHCWNTKGKTRSTSIVTRGKKWTAHSFFFPRVIEMRSILMEEGKQNKIAVKFEQN
jgi:hypothetical protein